MRPAEVFISYAHADERLRQALGEHLAALQREGLIHAWHDRKIAPGQEWAGTIDTNLEQADIIVLLVSASFLASTYCNDIELRRAMQRHERGEARVIPVILKPCDWTASPFAKLQALPSGKAITSFSNRDAAFLDVAKGIRQVALELARRPGGTTLKPGGAGGVAGPLPMAPEALEIPEGPVRHDSPFYIHPVGEARCFAELEKPGALIRIKGPRRFGKTSLNNRLLAYASGKGYRSVPIDLIGTDRKLFADPERFMQWFCATVGKGLGLRMRTEEYWDDMFGANDNSTDYFEKYLLNSDATPLVLTIDNFDRIYAHSEIETDFCGLLRSWHERARSKPLWERFRLVLIHTGEPDLPRNINQSPFNCGMHVGLEELSPEQVRYLVALHGIHLSEPEVGQLLELVGGHPYLVRKALYELANGLPFAPFLLEAATDAGIFSGHLRELLSAVEDHHGLGEALRQVMTSSKPVKLRPQETNKLASLGFLVLEGNLVRPRFSLYAHYFADRLAK